MTDEPEGAASLETGGTQPPARVRREFWLLVGIFNTALLAVAVGVLLLAFTDRGLAGGVFVGVGAGLAGYGARRYRRRKA